MLSPLEIANFQLMATVARSYSDKAFVLSMAATSGDICRPGPVYMVSQCGPHLTNNIVNFAILLKCKRNSLDQNFEFSQTRNKTCYAFDFFHWIQITWPLQCDARLLHFFSTLFTAELWTSHQLHLHIYCPIAKVTKEENLHFEDKWDITGLFKWLNALKQVPLGTLSTTHRWNDTSY